MIKVLKFGGTSVGSASAISAISRIVQLQLGEGHKLVLVASAQSGVTNQLIELARTAEAGTDTWRSPFNLLEQRHYATVKELLPASGQSPILAKLKMLFNQLEDVLEGITALRDLSPKTLDLVLSFGERLSVIIVAACLRNNGINAEAKDARELIKTDRRFGQARPDMVLTTTLVNQQLTFDPILVVTGFTGSTVSNETTTLGRGGSDYTAAILAAIIRADLIEIWTDVNGVLTADPKLVKTAFTQPSLSYQEAMEICHFGAKVIYPPTLLPAFQHSIPLAVKNTFEPEAAGTLICHDTSASDFAIKGVSCINDVALLNVQGTTIIGVAGVAARLFGALAAVQVNVILISQASSEHSICLAVHPADARKAREAIEAAFANELREGQLEPVQVQSNLAIVAAVGEGMARTPGISGKLFGALGRNGVNVVATAQGSSELNISVVVNQADLQKAVSVLHEVFFQQEKTRLNLFLIGPGLIGKTLLEQVRAQSPWLSQHRQMHINVAGIINTKRMAVAADGIDLEQWRTQLDQGRPADLGTFIKEVIALNLPNSVVADCTAGPGSIAFYESLLDNSIALVTPNKTANSGPLARYLRLQHLASRNNTRFLYETNAGAGLPILSTLRDLIQSGDQIESIEGVLSGTLSYIFNNFALGKTFKQCVAEAQELGYTEPDPRDDLSGLDMGRKMLILARECGLPAEPDDIDIEQILPESCLRASSVAAFYDCLDKEQAYFDEMAQQASAAGRVVRYIGKISGDKISIRLEMVGPESPFYSMRGSENMVVFVTKRYKQEAPMVVRGPGAGAEVTAAGVFAEIISVGSAAASKRL